MDRVRVSVRGRHDLVGKFWGAPQEEPRPCAFETLQRCAQVARALGGAPQRWVFSRGRWVRAGGCSHNM